MSLFMLNGYDSIRKLLYVIMTLIKSKGFCALYNEFSQIMVLENRMITAI